MATFSSLSTTSLSKSLTTSTSLSGTRISPPRYGAPGCTSFYDWNGINDNVSFGGNGAFYNPDTPLTPGVNCTYIDAGAGNDSIQLTGTTGVFDVVTGYGRDVVRVKDADYVRIENYDGGDASDNFEFNADFSGKAEIFSFDSNDLFGLNYLSTVSKLGDWHSTYSSATGDTIFHNAVTGGEIAFRGAKVTDFDTYTVQPNGANGFMICIPLEWVAG